LVRLEILAESLAEPENQPRFKKAIVPRITRIVMTTMSSTRVKPVKFLADFLRIFCISTIGMMSKIEIIYPFIISILGGNANFILIR
jgi:hypothetical protein